MSRSVQRRLIAQTRHLGSTLEVHITGCSACGNGKLCAEARRIAQSIEPSTFRDAIQQRPPASNSAGAGVTANQAEGIKAGGYYSRDLGKAGELDLEGGISSKQGWGVAAWWRKAWGK